MEALIRLYSALARISSAVLVLYFFLFVINVQKKFAKFVAYLHATRLKVIAIIIFRLT